MLQSLAALGDDIETQVTQLKMPQPRVFDQTVADQQIIVVPQDSEEQPHNHAYKVEAVQDLRQCEPSTVKQPTTSEQTEPSESSLGMDSSPFSVVLGSQGKFPSPPASLATSESTHFLVDESDSFNDELEVICKQYDKSPYQAKPCVDV